MSNAQPMPSTEQLQDLIARIEGLSGADREVDAALMALTYTKDERHLGTQEGNDFGGWEPVKDSVWVDPLTDRWVSTAPFHYTASTDAALKFIPRLLSNWHFTIDLPGNGKPSVVVSNGAVVASTPTPPLAIILATLKAKVAE